MPDQPENPGWQRIEPAYSRLKQIQFPLAHAQVGQQIRAVNTEFGNTIPKGSEERLRYALKLLDARAEPYLTLVSDIESQEAYAVLVWHFAQITWSDYTVVRFVPPLPGDPAMQRIKVRAAVDLTLADRCDFAQFIKIYASPREGETALLGR